MTALTERLNEVPLLGLMIVIATGFTLGRVTVRRLALGPAGGTLVAGLLLGHLGLRVGPDGLESQLGTLGFVLFIYSVGFDAAPHVVATFRDRRGIGYLGIAIMVNVVAVLTTFGAALALDLEVATATGLLAGALTSAPTYAAASEYIADQDQLAVAFAMTYPFGLVSLVLLVQTLPALLRQDLGKEARTDEELRARERGGPTAEAGKTPEVSRAYRARLEETLGKPLRELDLSHRTGCVIALVRRGPDLVVPDGDSVLENGDLLLVTGRVDELKRFESVVGPEDDESRFEKESFPTRQVVVRRRDVSGKSLAELDIGRRFHCVVLRIERGGLLIEPDAEVRLQRGDVVEIVGKRDHVQVLTRHLGHRERSRDETDIAAYAGGIALGLLLGSIVVPIAGVSLRLGLGAGLLLVGLALGSQPRIGPIRTAVPHQARQLVRDLGILLFIGEAALNAGPALAEGLAKTGVAPLATAFVINAVAVLGALLGAGRFSGLRPVDVWGAISGGLTSSAGLAAVRRAAESGEATIAYAAAYAPASLLATMAGPALVEMLT